ncbi:MAG: hypothetical protein KJZ87_00985, partial [Thermoguttaceae bacterium]|nr:hypothetical protein [Thermoguttaceae bacterium]
SSTRASSKFFIVAMRSFPFRLLVNLVRSLDSRGQACWVLLARRLFNLAPYNADKAASGGNLGEHNGLTYEHRACQNGKNAPAMLAPLFQKTFGCLPPIAGP